MNSERHRTTTDVLDEERSDERQETTNETKRLMHSTPIMQTTI